LIIAERGTAHYLAALTLNNTLLAVSARPLASQISGGWSAASALQWPGAIHLLAVICSPCATRAGEREKGIDATREFADERGRARSLWETISASEGASRRVG